MLAARHNPRLPRNTRSLHARTGQGQSTGRHARVVLLGAPDATINDHAAFPRGRRPASGRHVRLFHCHGVGWVIIITVRHTPRGAVQPPKQPLTSAEHSIHETTGTSPIADRQCTDGSVQHPQGAKHARRASYLGRLGQRRLVRETAATRFKGSGTNAWAKRAPQEQVNRSRMDPRIHHPPLRPPIRQSQRTHMVPTPASQCRHHP